MNHEIEKDWTTDAGLRAIVLMGSIGHRCGYVGVPEGHPLHGVSYNEWSPHVRPVGAEESIGKRGVISLMLADLERQTLDVIFNVHGSLTYSGGGDYPVQSDGLWWFGFDCGHHEDLPSPEWLAAQPDSTRSLLSHKRGEHRSLEYCIRECESLAAQIVDRTIVEGKP